MDTVLKSVNHQRIPEFDIMKGIAIICVVIGHYISLPLIPTIIWSFHMPLFVFLNGYFFKTNKPVRTIAKAYMKPYFIVWILLILFESLIYLYKTGIISLDVIETRFISGICALASNSTLNRPDWIIKIGAIWFLNALFLANIFAKGIFRLKSILFQIGITIGLFLLFSFLTRHYLVPFGLNYGVAFVFWMLVGYSFKSKDFFNSKFATKSNACIVLVLWMIIVLIEQLTHSQYNIIWIKLPLCGLEWIGALCGILSIYTISTIIGKNLFRVRQALTYIGEKSIWILCVHALSIELLPPPNGYLHTIIDIATALMVSHFYDKVSKFKCV